jgi:membrane-bound ClpP family serine protease
MLAALLTLAGCQPPPPTPQAQPAAAVIAGKAYLFFNAPIVPASRDLFNADIDKFLQAGATEIELAINSPGGDIDAAQDMVDHMTRLHAQTGVSFVTYNVGMVASAAIRWNAVCFCFMRPASVRTGLCRPNDCAIRPPSWKPTNGWCVRR